MTSARFSSGALTARAGVGPRAISHAPGLRRRQVACAKAVTSHRTPKRAGTFARENFSSGIRGRRWRDELRAAQSAVSVAAANTPKFLVVDLSENRACYYDSLFNLLSSSLMSTTVLNGVTNASDVVATTTAAYVLDGVNKCIYRSTAAGTVAVKSRTLLTNTGTTLTTPTGLTLSNDTLWLVDQGRSSIYRYSLSAAFTGTGTLNAVARIALAGANSAAESVWKIGRAHV